MTKKYIFRTIIYAIGMVTLALGLSLNTCTDLGVSAIISTAYAPSVVWNISFGDTTLILYIVLIIAQIVIHALSKKYVLIPVDISQFALSFVFSRLLNVFALILPHFSQDFPGTFLASLPFRIFILALAIICTGTGAAMSLDMRLIPNPGDGIVQAVSDFTGKPLGLIKNCVDISCVVITCCFGLILTGRPVGIGLGTLMSMLGVGRVIALFNRLFFKKLTALGGVNINV